MLTLGLVLCGLAPLLGQNTISKTIANPNIIQIQVDAKDCYQLTVSNSGTNELKVIAKLDGEYKDDLVVSLEETGKTIAISTGFQPGFVAPNDKLSAHKEVSIGMEIQVPIYGNLQIFGTSVNMQISGKYGNLMVVAADGRCQLNTVEGAVDVRTQDGDIWLLNASGTVDTETTYGKVTGETIPAGNSSFKLVSKEGNIYLNQTK